RLERNGALRGLDDLVDLLRRHFHRLGNLFRGWLATERLRELVQGLPVARNRVTHVDGKANGAALVRDGAGDRLANPPGRVGAEAEALAPVVLLDGAHQADVALLDQVQQGQATVHV